LPDLWAVRLIYIINEVIFYRIFESPKLVFEPYFRGLISVSLAVIAFNNYATFVEVEIMFWTYGIARFRVGEVVYGKS